MMWQCLEIISPYLGFLIPQLFEATQLAAHSKRWRAAPTQLKHQLSMCAYEQGMKADQLHEEGSHQLSAAQLVVGPPSTTCIEYACRDFNDVFSWL